MLPSYGGSPKADVKGAKARKLQQQGRAVGADPAQAANNTRMRPYGGKECALRVQRLSRIICAVSGTEVLGRLRGAMHLELDFFLASSIIAFQQYHKQNAGPTAA